MWLNLSGAQGNAYGTKSRDIVGRSMTPQQIAEGQNMARECERHKFNDCD